jgi:hypothetical protein
MPYLEFESEWIDPHVFEFTYKSEYQVAALTKEEINIYRLAFGTAMTDIGFRDCNGRAPASFRQKKIWVS